jgi:hypothetical protein
VVLCRTNSGNQTAQASVTAAYRCTPPQKVWECAAVVTLRLLRMSVGWHDRSLGHHFVHTSALVLASACRCQTLALTRSTCCYPGDAVQAHSCFPHAERQTAMALEGGLGYIAVDSGLARVGASGAGQTLVEGAHGHGGLYQHTISISI